MTEKYDIVWDLETSGFEAGKAEGYALGIEEYQKNS